MKTFSHKNGKSVGLGNLLHPLYDGTDTNQFPMALLNNYVCGATKVVNLEDGELDGSTMESLNTDAIFFGINTLCGIDIAFVARNRCDDSHKLVAIQSKNDKSITVKEVLMTLRPGL